ncbi:MAG: serine--tRNA ligase [Deferribacteraceae bacterium]|jgi:seryl-tRNA synthetase|nr:serine--tRNA ligase [Deferribacteraceae bacterium]
MLDIKFLLSNLDLVADKLKARGADIDLAAIVKLDKERKAVIAETEELKRLRNEISKQVGVLKREGQDTTALQQQVKNSADRMEALDADLKVIEEKLRDITLTIPNIIDDSVPIGKDETENTLYRTWGEIPTFDFEPKAHWDIAGELGILDFERGTKVAKSRFTMIMGHGARMGRALVAFMMDLHASRGYTEVLPPYMINPEALLGTGQLPKFQEELFWCERDNLYLTPTAEVPVTNLYAGEILPEADLPLRYTAYSACFRREAGSYGKDVRGLIRQHQFDKVELVKFATPENSMAELESMVSEAEEVLKRLNLAYRVITLCSGDIGFSSAKTYDIEVWLPAQNTYREISSCSTCTDFQARRANIRYRNKEGKVNFLHTLNGSGLAVGRTLVAILENYQQADGSVIVPEALRPYMGGLERLTK